MYVTRKQIDKAVKGFLAEVDDEADIREDYCGRGMYRRTCFGVVGSSVTIALQFMFSLAEAMYPEEDYFDMKEAVLELAEGMRTDSMGRSDTIYYFPDLVIEEN